MHQLLYVINIVDEPWTINCGDAFRWSCVPYMKSFFFITDTNYTKLITNGLPSTTLTLVGIPWCIPENSAVSQLGLASAIPYVVIDIDNCCVVM